MEFELHDINKIELDMNVFSMLFNVDIFTVPSSLQLELIELQLKQRFQNMSKLEFYKSLLKTDFSNFNLNVQKIMSMFRSIYANEHSIQ